VYSLDLPYVFLFLQIFYIHWGADSVSLVTTQAINTLYRYSIRLLQLLLLHWILTSLLPNNKARVNDTKHILDWQPSEVWSESCSHMCTKFVQVFWSGNKCPRIPAGRHELQFCSFVCTYYLVGQRHVEVLNAIFVPKSWSIDLLALAITGW
jgi:hypothetical protein